MRWAGRTVSLGYDATSLRTHLTYPNGIETTYAVNPAVQLTEVLAQRPATSSVLDRTGYTYDAFGQRETKTRATGRRPTATTRSAAWRRSRATTPRAG